jgi:serine protease
LPDRFYRRLGSPSIKIPLSLVLIVSLSLFGVALGMTRGNAALPYPSNVGINSNKLALPGVVVVKFKPGVEANLQELFKVPELESRILKEANPTSMESVLNVTHARLSKTSETLSNIYLVRYTGMVTPALAAESIIKNSDVEYAEPHYVYRVNYIEFVPDDSLIQEQYALSKIDAYQAWNISRGDSSVIIGIVDTGVDWMHPDLYPNIWHNPHWRTDTKYPGDSIGWDFGGHDASGTQNSDPREDFPAHGTHVAGIAAAVSNNRIGIAGVAQCKIMAVKTSQEGYVDSNGEPYIVWGFEGIIYAADNGAKVINCSWGGIGFSQYEQDVINYATAEGALVVAAAGNDHSTEFQTPAYYDNVLSVAATDSNDRAASFTNFNYDVSVSAPGANIISTWGQNSYVALSGTSMASPCAAGVAALVASQHPDYLPQQIMEQVRVSADDINAVNPDYTYMLGYGRVNAYRALTVSSPGVRIDSLILVDSTGNENGEAFAAGTTVHVLGKVTNWLSPTGNLQLELSSADPYVTVLHADVSVGVLQTKGSYELQINDLSFRVNGNTPYEHSAVFLVKMTDGNYSDYQSFIVLLNPRFSQLTFNNVATTITSKGNIGYNDYPNNTQGIGLIYQPDRAEVLFEGAFMAGISSGKEVDVARDSSGSEESNDFKPGGLVEVKTSNDGLEQESTSTFTDSNATTNQVGIQVTLRTYAYKSDSTSNFIILEYTVHNLNSSPLNNFYCGIFLDWDISPYDDMAMYDRSYNLGYAYDSTRSTKTYTGCALISGENANYTAINNNDPNTGANTGFSKERKWSALTGQTGIQRVGPADISMVVSGGPVTISGKSDTIFAFVLAAGDTLQDLENAVRVAREIYNSTNVVIPPSFPRLAVLYQNYPNPFPNPSNPSTTIPFDVIQQSRVTIEVFNVIGQKVMTLTDRSYPPGDGYKVYLPADRLASGVYFVRLTAASGTQSLIQTKKIEIIK